MSDVPVPMVPVLATTLDLMQDQVENVLCDHKPDFILFDVAHWVTGIACSLGIMPMYYVVASAVALGHFFVPSRKLQKGKQLTDAEMMTPPEGYPLPLLKLTRFEAFTRVYTSRDFGIGVSFHDRLVTSMLESEAICFRGCREVDGPFCDYFERQYGRQIILTGPGLNAPTNAQLEESLAKWLSQFKEQSVVYYALGSETVLDKYQFQELVLGLELTGLPFLAALKKPLVKKWGGTLRMTNFFNEDIDGINNNSE